MWSDRTARGLFAGIVMGVAMSLVACHATGNNGSEGDMDLVSQGVTVTSYNYSDRALNDITVDGAWTGGLDAFAGGGNLSGGLMAPKDRTRQHSVKVRWDVGSRYDIATNTYPGTMPVLEPHEATVPIQFPYPSHIEYLILHFYPDGRVEAEFTESIPGRRIPEPAGYRR